MGWPGSSCGAVCAAEQTNHWNHLKLAPQPLDHWSCQNPSEQGKNLPLNCAGPLAPLHAEQRDLQMMRPPDTQVQHQACSIWSASIGPAASGRCLGVAEGRAVGVAKRVCRGMARGGDRGGQGQCVVAGFPGRCGRRQRCGGQRRGSVVAER